MEGSINEENYWNHNVEGDAVEGAANNLCRYEAASAEPLKTVNNQITSHRSLELITLTERCANSVDGRVVAEF